MTQIGIVETVCRYPVKSMRGQALEACFAGFPGLMGDRVFAFVAAETDPAFPWHTARQQEDLVLYQPRYRSDRDMASPEFLAASEELAPGVNPIFPDTPDFAVDVETPSGQRLPIDSGALLSELAEKSQQTLRLHYSQRGLYDCRPISLISLNAIDALSQELGQALDPRQFRANLYARWSKGAPDYLENDLVGARLRIGARLELFVLERDPRCKMITIDPDTAETTPGVLRHVSRKHGNKAGVFAAVLREGLVQVGDPIVLVEKSLSSGQG